MVALMIVAWVLSARRPDSKTWTRRVIAVSAACAAGVLIAIAIQSIAGYPIRARGMASRSTYAVTFWLITFATVGSLPIVTLPRPWRQLGLAAAFYADPKPLDRVTCGGVDCLVIPHPGRTKNAENVLQSVRDFW